MLGLKNPERFRSGAGCGGRSGLVCAALFGYGGNIWRKLSVRDLLADHDFMNIGV
jgi:twitching motility protein PilI